MKAMGNIAHPLPFLTSAQYCGGTMTVMDAPGLTDSIQRWLAQTELPIQPKHARIGIFEDALGQEG